MCSLIVIGINSSIALASINTGATRTNLQEASPRKAEVSPQEVHDLVAACRNRFITVVIFMVIVLSLYPSAFVSILNSTKVHGQKIFSQKSS